MSDVIEEKIPVATNAKSGSIAPIDKNCVHKICSGQVVLSLAIAVKELVENAIDAGATLIEVKLRDQGIDSLEVSDNGCGVEAHNLEAMTAKYHTSKIREFVDLQGVETFGFRGEALSSLCALSDMTIQTRHESSDVGTKLILDHDGKIVKRTHCAREIGTSVTLCNLFVTLPVRRRDFTRNIKKEFTKMCQIMQAYCLVSTGVRIICSNQTPKGAKTIVLQTHGAQDVRANITAIFGNRQSSEIVPLKSHHMDEKLNADSLGLDLQTVDGETTIQISDEDIEQLNAAEFQLEGFISSCSHGSGRSTKDRQFYFVNSRPCDPKNIAKVVNEIYHRYNIHQYPFVYLNVLTARADVDVNLTPDKRQLLLNNEKIILLALKKALLNTFGSIPSTYRMQNSSIVSFFEAKCKDEPNTVATTDSESELVPISTTKRFMDVLSQWKHTGDTKGIAPSVSIAKRKCNDEITVRTQKLQKIQHILNSSNNSKEATFKGETDTEDECESEKSVEGKSNLNESLLDVHALQAASQEYDDLVPAKQQEQPTKVLPNDQPYLNFVNVKSNDSVDAIDELKLTQASTSSTETDTSIVDTQERELDKKIIELDGDDDDNDDGDAHSAHQIYTCGKLRTSLAEIALNRKSEDYYVNEKCTKSKLQRLRFKSEINPKQNENAEAELQKEIMKEDFARMSIIGQFNLGFIIVKLDDDLFIVDQHATDEKYNFETLQRTTTLQYQKLAVPQKLELTAVNELILLDNLENFEKNGFKFEINAQASPTQKVRLLGKPVSKNWQFGKEDIDELIFMLHDAPEGSICRPTRIRAMFASRACRKSIMIGKALNKATMSKLIRHMGEIEQPWNCPHGRPTMRHLVNTKMLMDEDDVDAAN